jgi:hypothetical protein
MLETLILQAGENRGQTTRGVVLSGKNSATPNPDNCWDWFYARAPRCEGSCRCQISALARTKTDSGKSTKLQLLLRHSESQLQRELNVSAPKFAGGHEVEARGVRLVYIDLKIRVIESVEEFAAELQVPALS